VSSGLLTSKNFSTQAGSSIGPFQFNKGSSVFLENAGSPSKNYHNVELFKIPDFKFKKYKQNMSHALASAHGNT